MNHIAALLVFGICFALMAVGLFFGRKVLKKRCSDEPSSCACRRQGTPPEECDQ